MDWKQNWNRCIGRDDDWILAEPVQRVGSSSPAPDFVNTVNYVNRPQKCILDDSEDIENLVEYLVENINSGGAYARSFLNVRAYLRREFASHQFDQIEKAFMGSPNTAVTQTQLSGSEGTSYPDQLGRVKCTHCRNLSGARCLKLHEPAGTCLLRTCDDFREM